MAKGHREWKCQMFVGIRWPPTIDCVLKRARRVIYSLLLTARAAALAIAGMASNMGLEHRLAPAFCSGQGDEHGLNPIALIGPIVANKGKELANKLGQEGQSGTSRDGYEPIWPCHNQIIGPTNGTLENWQRAKLLLANYAS